MARLITLLSALSVTLAAPSSLFPRQTSIDPSNQWIYDLKSSGAPYDGFYVAGVVYNTTLGYGPAIVGLIRPPLAYPLTYSVQDGKVRAGSDFGGESWFQMPATTGLINYTDAASASEGFTYGVDAAGNTDHLLRYQGSEAVWWGCTSMQPDGRAVLYVEIDGIPPTDGDCTQVTLVGEGNPSKR
ncbi:MAG: hypothetical protein Q9227_007791 [Pyrenula ochraceoflavens]